MSKLAIYKSKVWDFQKEIRFIVSFSPSPFNKDFTSNHDFNLTEAFKTKNIPFEFLDLELSNRFFEDLEITFGPKCPPVHKELIRMFVKKFGFEPIISDSELKIA
ncbi:hypothetical protein D3H64_10095 [Atopobacter sp. AH10]|uniref:hypothetical protein n=1 Tax=Atopobacter sp. AH10 TaxID=2315861 RepID=UPI000EF19B81|nr:hypothetical protein [Atopobacter sp. AH10]RLK62391.1 hypothetical protein D3H64_10095 [Atopobacter sp. AH10]